MLWIFFALGCCALMIGAPVNAKHGRPAMVAVSLAIALFWFALAYMWRK